MCFYLLGEYRTIIYGLEGDCTSETNPLNCPRLGVSASGCTPNGLTYLRRDEVTFYRGSTRPSMSVHEHGRVPISVPNGTGNSSLQKFLPTASGVRKTRTGKSRYGSGSSCHGGGVAIRATMPAWRMWYIRLFAIVDHLSTGNCLLGVNTMVRNRFVDARRPSISITE